MNRRSLLLGASLLSVCAALAPGSLMAQGTTLTVLLPPWLTLPKEMTDAYEAATGGTLDTQTLGWDEIHTKVVTSMVANTAPASITEVDWSWVGQFGSAGWYDDLSGVLPDDVKADLPALPIFTFDGKLLGIPYNNDFRVMFYNKAHLDAAGVAVPTTPDELVAAAKAIKASGAAEFPIGLPLSATEGSATAWYLMTKIFGGDLFDADFEPLFTDPASAGYKAMEFEVALIKDGLVDPAATGLKDVDVQELFKAGKVSFEIAGWAGNVAVYTDPGKSSVAADVHAALEPNVNGKSRTFGLPEALGIPVSADNKEAAAAFITWMLEPAQLLNSYKTLGNLPPRLSVLQQLAADGSLKEGDVMIAQAAVMEPLIAQGTPGWYPEFSAAVASNLNAAAKGEMSVADAVAAIAAAAEAAKAG